MSSDGGHQTLTSINAVGGGIKANAGTTLEYILGNSFTLRFIGFLYFDISSTQVFIGGFRCMHYRIVTLLFFVYMVYQHFLYSCYALERNKKKIQIMGLT